MLSRKQAFVILKKYLKDEDNIKISIATEAILKEMARNLNFDEELWGITGLLHNLDYEYTLREPEKKGTLSAQLLDGLIPEQAVNAIKANNYMHTDYIPTTALDKALIATAAISGLIIVTVKLTQSNKIDDVDLELLIDKFNDKTFAVRYNRNRIGLCTDAGIELKYFLELSLNTLKSISKDLGI